MAREELGVAMRELGVAMGGGCGILGVTIWGMAIWGLRGGYVGN